MYTPSNTVIIFDIVDVIVQHSNALESNPNKLLPLFIKKQYSLVPDIEHIINDLHLLGYTLHLASNADRSEFAAYCKLFPDVFSRFSEAKIAGSPDCFLKPHAVYFQEYLDDLALEDKPHRIFIDDKMSNISAAIAHDFIGIQFKDADQLRYTLQKLSIL
jgi:FMN phosphatase YigB (HAD superfamily)